jgi:uncharacterized membrane protein YuzA (DUF378 family)
MSLHPLIGYISYILVIVGALNWGLVGVLGVDLIARIFGTGSVGAKIMYILIGVSAIVLLIS